MMTPTCAQISNTADLETNPQTKKEESFYFSEPPEFKRDIMVYRTSRFDAPGLTDILRRFAIL